MKKTVFSLVVALLVFAQVYFIYFLYAWRELLHEFSYEPTEYSEFMFACFDLLWFFPCLCGLLAYWTFRHWSTRRVFAALLVIPACCVALFWGTYAISARILGLPVDDVSSRLSFLHSV